MNNRGCLGRKMYADSTLKSFTKDELIELLHLADYNYCNLEETYETSVANAKKMFEKMKSSNGYGYQPRATKNHIKPPKGTSGEDA